MAKITTMIQLSEMLADVEELGLTKVKSRAVTEKLFDLIREEVKAGNKVSIKNFGRFETRHRSARPYRNPITGEQGTTTEKDVLGFKSACEIN